MNITTPRKYDGIKTDLEDYTMNLLLSGKIKLSNPDDKAVYDKIQEAIELCESIAHYKQEQYNDND